LRARMTSNERSTRSTIGSLRFPGSARSTCACFAERREDVERAGVDRGVTRASGISMTAAGGREAAAAAAAVAAAAAAVAALALALAGRAAAVATNATTARRGARRPKSSSDDARAAERRRGETTIRLGAGGRPRRGARDRASPRSTTSRRTEIDDRFNSKILHSSLHLFNRRATVDARAASFPTLERLEHAPNQRLVLVL